MSTITSNFAGAVTATSFSGDGSSLTSLARANLAVGMADHVLINDGSGNLSSEAQLTTARGGIGVDISGSTGALIVTAGTGSAATQLASSMGGTSADLSAATGAVIISAGTMSSEATLNGARGGTGADLSAATAGPVITNGAGVMSSVAQLTVADGGTGQDFSGVGAGPFAITNSSGTMSSSIAVGTTATANMIVQRDGSGNLPTLGDAIVTKLTNNSQAGSGARQWSDVGYVQTSDETPTAVYTISTSKGGTNGTAYFVAIEASYAQAAAGKNFGAQKGYLRAVNDGTLDASAGYFSQNKAETGISTSYVALNASGSDLQVRVIGDSTPKTINWCVMVRVTEMDY